LVDEGGATNSFGTPNTVTTHSDARKVDNVPKNLFAVPMYLASRGVEADADHYRAGHPDRRTSDYRTAGLVTLRVGDIAVVAARWLWWAGQSQPPKRSWY
jgi:hypothetical protein